MITGLLRLFSKLYIKCIFIVADKLGLLLFFFQTIFKPSEFIYTIDNNRLWVRKNTSDVFVLKEVFTSKVYGEKPRGIVVDIGANIGAFSVYSGGTSDRVFAFEPEPSNYCQLLKNVQLNNLSDKITVRNVAVGHENKRVYIYEGKFNKGASTIVHPFAGVGRPVEMRSFAGLMDDLGIDKIDLLKIDIEGGEYDLLYGLPRERFKNINNIILEFHCVMGESPSRLSSYLTSLGYDVSTHKGLGFLLGTGTLRARRLEGHLTDAGAQLNKQPSQIPLMS